MNEIGVPPDASLSELQPGVVKYVMEYLDDAWPEWDINTVSDGERNSKFPTHTELWPTRQEVARQVLRALHEAGMVRGVVRADYANPDHDLPVAALLLNVFRAPQGDGGMMLNIRDVGPNPLSNGEAAYLLQEATDQAKLQAGPGPWS